MSEKSRTARDGYTFSLRGMKSIASFAFAPAIAGDPLNRAIDERIRRARNSQRPPQSDWQGDMQGNCA